MIFVLALLGLAAWAVAATIVAVARDGYRQLPTVTHEESYRAP